MGRWGYQQIAAKLLESVVNKYIFVVVHEIDPVSKFFLIVDKQSILQRTCRTLKDLMVTIFNGNEDKKRRNENVRKKIKMFRESIKKN